MTRFTPAERRAEAAQVNRFLDSFNEGGFHVGKILTTDDVSMLAVAALRLERQRAATQKAGRGASKKKIKALTRNAKQPRPNRRKQADISSVD